MTEEAAAPSGEAAARTNQPKANPIEQFVLIVAFVVGMLILLDPAARMFTGAIVGAVLEPLIGFDRAVPVMTVLLASAIMVSITTAVRHYFTDYLQQARSQEVMKAFNRELRDARKENNLHKMKRLTEKNNELMKLQADQSSAQLKPMAITMVVVVPIFAWLLVFLDPSSHAAANPACETIIRVPWDARWCMDINIEAAPLTFIPRWVALYSLFSIPLGQLVQRTLKARDLQKELAEKGAGQA